MRPLTLKKLSFRYARKCYKEYIWSSSPIHANEWKGRLALDDTHDRLCKCHILLGAVSMYHLDHDE